MDQNYKIIITEGGQQIPVSAPDGLDIKVFIEGDEIVQEIPLDVTAEEFAELQKQAVTNDIPADILNPNEADTPQ